MSRFILSAGTGNGGGGGDPAVNGPPVPKFSFVVTDFDVVFDASESSDSDGVVSEYDWQFGDGSTASGVTQNKKYSNAGDYEVFLTVVDDKGFSTSYSQIVTIAATVGAPATLCDVAVKRIRFDFKNLYDVTQGVGLDFIRGYASQDGTGTNLIGQSAVQSATANSQFNSSFAPINAFRNVTNNWGAVMESSTDKWIEAVLVNPVALSSLVFQKEGSFTQWKTDNFTVTLESDTGEVYQAVIPWANGSVIESADATRTVLDLCGVAAVEYVAPVVVMDESMTVSHVSFNSQASAGIIFNDDGTISRQRGSVVSQIGVWHSDAPLVGLGAGHEIQAINQSGSGSLDVGVFNAFSVINGNAWRIDSFEEGFLDVGFDVEIKPTGGAVADTSSILLRVEGGSL